MNKLPNKKTLKTRSRTHKAYFALLLATAIWGGATVVIKITLSYIPPFSFLLYRFLLVAIVMLPIMVVELKRTSIDKRDLKNLILLGLFGQASLAFIFLGIKYTTALDTAIIGTVAPLLTIAAGHFFYKERISKIAQIGIIIATFGMLIVVLEPVFESWAHQSTNIESGIQRIIGNLFVLLYNLSFTLYILWSKLTMGKKSANLNKTFKLFHIKPMHKVYSPILHTTFSFYVGLTAIIPLAVLENLGYFGNQTFVLSNLKAPVIFGVLYMAIFSSIVAYLAFEWGLKKAEVSDQALFGYLGPLFTLPFAYILLKEVPTSVNLIGAVIIAIGVVIAEKNKHIKPVKKS